METEIEMVELVSGTAPTTEEARLGQLLFFFRRGVWADKQSSPGHDGKEKKKLCNSRAYSPVLKCSLPYLHLNCMCFEDSRISVGLDMYQGFLLLHCQTV